MDQASTSIPSGTSRVLCRLGVLLILLGLATGAAIPLFDDARRGLAAHTTGVQNGILLTLLGLLWQRLWLPPALLRLTAGAGVFSLYAIWLAFLLTASFGAGPGAAVAGAGVSFGPDQWQGSLVAILRGAGSVALLAALLAVLWGLRPPRPPSG
jgi:hydroxylaminobenzene mutase